MSVVDDFLETVADGAKELATEAAFGFVDQLRDGATDFAQESLTDFRRWSKQFAHGDLTRLEFDTLAKTLQGEAALRALTRAGIAAAQAQKLRDAVIKLVVDSAIKVLI